jgi:hypothetical protein
MGSSQTVIVSPGCGVSTFDEFVRRLVEHGERLVVARHHRLELEEAAAGERRHGAAHGEAVADRHQTDFRFMQLVDQRHIGENVGVAHVVERRRFGEMQHQAERIAEIGVLAALAAEGR